MISQLSEIILVSRGRKQEKGDRRSHQQWKDNNLAPQVVCGG